MRKIHSVLFLTLILITTITGQSEKFSGLMFGDYYNNIQNHNSDISGKHGFWFRRIYFTYDYTYNKSFSTRLRLEMADDGKYADSKSLTPFVKDAYLQYKFGMQNAKFGISSPPTFKLIEKIWGYRAVEKTMLDLQRMASSRDFGISVAGSLINSGKLKYHLMIANGSGNKQEIDKGKSFMASVSYWFSKNIVCEVYGDYIDRTNDENSYIAQGFIGYKSQNYNAGIQYSAQTIESEDENISNTNLVAISLFASGKIYNKIKLLGRIDKMVNPNPNGDNIAFTPYNTTSPFTMYLAGVDFEIVKDVSFIPNFTYVAYEKDSFGIKPDSDLYGRVTFFWKFK